jgi:hypothetical protein
MRGERAARAAQSATSEETKKGTGGNEKDDGRQRRAGEASEDRPGAGSTSDGDKEKSKSTVEGDKEKTIAEPGSADGVRRRYLRPPSGSLEHVQRDSRFIEDVS